MSLLTNVKIDQILGYYAAGTTKRTSDIIDMAGYEGCMFIFELGTLINAGTVKCYLEGNNANSTSGMAELAGCPTVTVDTTIAALAKSAVAVDVYQPTPDTYRYIQANITPASQNAVILGITAIRYNGKLKPESVAGLLAGVQLTSPAAA